MKLQNCAFDPLVFAFFILNLAATNQASPNKDRDIDKSKVLKLYSCTCEPDPLTHHDSGYTNEKGEKGENGVPGLQGYPGIPGMPGIKGDRGEKGGKGENGVPGLQGPPGIPGMPGYEGDTGEKGNKGEMGNDGMVGPMGIPGIPGIQGVKGDKGDRGESGSIGMKGTMGKKGDTGDKGSPGFLGIPGIPGMKGDKGSMGEIGLPGVCYQTCTSESVSDYDYVTSETVKKYGTLENPTDSLCSVIRNPEKFSGLTWVYKKKKFQVDCRENTGLTCLIKNNHKAGESGATDIFFSPVNQTTPFWLSSLPGKSSKFDLERLYGVTSEQLAWLQSQSKDVYQVIRYHCKNSHVTNNLDTALHFLSSNDIVIGPEKSDQSPLSYIIKSDDHKCVEGATKIDWLHTDIMIRGSSKRLPITDVRIKDVRAEEQSFYLESMELCFS